MGWFGKIVGGTIGFALGGPLGAVAGAAFGHAFDKNEETGYPGQGRGARLSMGESAQMTFFVATFSMLAKITGVDGHISKEEIDSIENFMRQDLNLSPGSRQAAIDIFHAAGSSPQTFQDFAVQFYNAFQYQPRLLEMMIDVLLRVSVSDGNLSDTEERLILSAVDIFGFSDETYRKLRSKYIAESEKYYAVLGCSRSDPVDRIKKQYRKLVFEYHPDKIISKGLPDEFVKLAHDKFREIQEAYEYIRKERGIK